MSKIAALVVSGIFFACPVFAQDQVKGSLTVDGKAMPITHVYAYAKKAFFDATKDDVIVLLCDAAVPLAAVRDKFALSDLGKAGKVHCVQQTIDAEKKVTNFRLEHDRFKIPEGGFSTEQVFEATTFDGKTIAGRAYTKSPQKSFEDVIYSYDITFSAAIGAK